MTHLVKRPEHEVTRHDRLDARRGSELPSIPQPQRFVHQDLRLSHASRSLKCFLDVERVNETQSRHHEDHADEIPVGMPSFEPALDVGRGEHGDHGRDAFEEDGDLRSDDGIEGEREHR